MNGIVKCGILVWVFLLINPGISLGFAGGLQNTSTEDEQFDLIVYGKHLDAATLTVELKSNPLFGSSWEPADGQTRAPGSQLLVIKNLSRKRYLGQDIRENYLALRLSAKGTETVEISAIYVLPSGDTNKKIPVEELQEVIEERPRDIRAISLAGHVRPRPYFLDPGASWTEHVEAPVRQHKPGVREVQWLDILFSDRVMPESGSQPM